MTPIVRIVVGVVFVPLCIVTVFVAIPRFPDDLQVKETAAWLWKPGAAELARIPFHQPLHDVNMLATRDGGLVAYGSGDDEFQRFDSASGAFVAWPGHDGTIYPQAPAPIGGFNGFEPLYLNCASTPPCRDGWLEVERKEPKETARTLLATGGKWTAGPALPFDSWTESAARLDDGTLVVTEQIDQRVVVFTAAPGDTAFARLTLRGSPNATGWPVSNILLADGQRLLIVSTTGEHPTTIETRIVDVKTGAVTKGASHALDAPDTVVSVSGGAVPGGVLFATSRRTHAYDPRWLIPNVLGIALIPAEIAGVVAIFRRRGGGSRRFFIIGVIVATVVLAFAAFVFLQGMNGLAHM